MKKFEIIMKKKYGVFFFFRKGLFAYGFYKCIGGRGFWSRFFGIRFTKVGSEK